MHCPYCNSIDIVKNGSNAVGTPKFLCKSCARQLVESPKQQRLSDEPKGLIYTLLLERIPLAGIARVTGVSERWLHSDVNEKYEAVPRQIEVKKKRKAG
jgi:transposase-like protein